MYDELDHEEIEESVDLELSDREPFYSMQEDDESSLIEPDSKDPGEVEGLLTPPSRWDRLIGIFFLLVSGFCFSIMSLFAALLIDVIPPTELVLVRGICQVLPVLIWNGFIKAQDCLGPPGHRHWLSLRGLLGVIALFCYYLSLKYLPLSDSSLIIATTPIWVGLMAWLLLGEPYTWCDILGSLVSVVGMVLVVHPTFLFHPPSLDRSLSPLLHDALSPSSSYSGLFGAGAALSSAIISALVYVLIRKIGNAVPASVLVLYWGLAALLLYLPLIFLLSEPLVVPQTALQWFQLSGVGWAAFGAQYFFNKGVQREKAAIASVIRNSGALYSILYQVLFLTIPSGFVYTLIGGALIFGVIFGTAIYKYKTSS